MKTTDYNVLRFDAAKNKLVNITLGYGFDNLADAKAFADEEFAKTGLSTAVRADYYDIPDDTDFPVMEGQEIVYTKLAEGINESVFSIDANGISANIPGDPVEADDTGVDIDYIDMVEALEENEDQVECKVCFGLFPKVDCKKLDVGYICPVCGQELASHQGTNLDLVDADPTDLQYDDPRVTKFELEEPEAVEVTDGTDMRAHEAGIKPIAEEDEDPEPLDDFIVGPQSDENIPDYIENGDDEVLNEHVNEEHPPVESDQELKGIDNAVVDCQGPNKVVTHAEDEKPLDCLMKKEPLEKPLTEEYFKEAIEKEVDLDKKLKLYNDYIEFLNNKKAELEKDLLKADNELIANDIKKDLAETEATLDKDLPEAIKDTAVEEPEAKENETAEVSDSAEEPKAEANESLNNSEALKDAEENSELATENKSENLTLNEDVDHAYITSGVVDLSPILGLSFAEEDLLEKNKVEVPAPELTVNYNLPWVLDELEADSQKPIQFCTLENITLENEKTGDFYTTKQKTIYMFTQADASYNDRFGVIDPDGVLDQALSVLGDAIDDYIDPNLAVVDGKLDEPGYHTISPDEYRLAQKRGEVEEI